MSACLYCINVRRIEGHAAAQSLQAESSHVLFPMLSLECFIDKIQLHYGPGAHPPSNRNEYQEYFLGVNAASA